MQKCSNRSGYLNSLQIRVRCILGLWCVLYTGFMVCDVYCIYGVCCLLGLRHGADTQVVTDVSNDRTVLKTIYRKILCASVNLLSIYLYFSIYSLTCLFFH